MLASIPPTIITNYWPLALEATLGAGANYLAPKLDLRFGKVLGQKVDRLTAKSLGAQATKDLQKMMPFYNRPGLLAFPVSFFISKVLEKVLSKEKTQQIEGEKKKSFDLEKSLLELIIKWVASNELGEIASSLGKHHPLARGLGSVLGVIAGDYIFKFTEWLEKKIGHTVRKAFGREEEEDLDSKNKKNETFLDSFVRSTVLTTIIGLKFLLLAIPKLYFGFFKSFKDAGWRDNFNASTQLSYEYGIKQVNMLLAQLNRLSPKGLASVKPPLLEMTAHPVQNIERLASFSGSMRQAILAEGKANPLGRWVSASYLWYVEMANRHLLGSPNLARELDAGSKNLGPAVAKDIALKLPVKGLLLGLFLLKVAVLDYLYHKVISPFQPKEEEPLDPASSFHFPA